jgi:hypothetical protein
LGEVDSPSSGAEPLRSEKAPHGTFILILCDEENPNSSALRESSKPKQFDVRTTEFLDKVHQVGLRDGTWLERDRSREAGGLACQRQSSYLPENRRCGVTTLRGIPHTTQQMPNYMSPWDRPEGCLTEFSPSTWAVVTRAGVRRVGRGVRRRRWVILASLSDIGLLPVRVLTVS